MADAVHDLAALMLEVDHAPYFVNAARGRFFLQIEP